MRILQSCGMALGVVILSGCGAGISDNRLTVPGHEMGIEVLGIELMAGGDLARLNYRVIDYERAKRAMEGVARIDPGAAGPPLELMSAGRLGAIRQRPSSTGKKQFMLFTNSGRVLRRGDSAVLMIGPSRIPGIPVS